MLWLNNHAACLKACTPRHPTMGAKAASAISPGNGVHAPQQSQGDDPNPGGTKPVSPIRTNDGAKAMFDGAHRAGGSETGAVASSLSLGVVASSRIG